MRRLALALTLLLAACPAGRRLNPADPYPIERIPLTVELAPGLTTEGILTFPHIGKGPHPTVILVHGSGPQDMDATVDGPWGVNPVFEVLADRLAERGFAVVRYHKRHVRGPKQFDLPKFVADQSTFAFRDDLEAVLAAAKAQPRVDPNRVFLYGWSEGSVVATAVAAAHPELAGLVLHGPVGLPWREAFRGWLDELTVPYLRRFAGPDGALDGVELARAMNAAACQPALLTSSMLAVSWSRHDDIATPTPLIDRDRNGRIELETELEPRLGELVDLAFGPLGQFQIYEGERTLPPVTDQVGAVKVPVLVLQGEHDAHTPPANADAVEGAMRAAGVDGTVARLPGLGHTLGTARDPVDDLGRPMAPEAVDALARWLADRARALER